MAYAGDLKSPDAHASCGFDPHPGHQTNSNENGYAAASIPKDTTEICSLGVRCVSGLRERERATWFLHPRAAIAAVERSKAMTLPQARSPNLETMLV